MSDVEELLHKGITGERANVSNCLDPEALRMVAIRKEPPDYLSKVPRRI